MRRDDNWMQTHTGRQVWPLDLRPEDVVLDDIAHSLSMQTRYAGHAPEPYTIAQHSVFVSRRAQQLAERLHKSADYCFNAARWGLLHDASEAYLVDVPRPVKPMLDGYYEIEDRLMKTIADVFELDEEPFEVKMADNDTLVAEAAMFFPVEERPAAWDTHGDNYMTGGFEVLDHGLAKMMFLVRAAELGIC